MKKVLSLMLVVLIAVGTVSMVASPTTTGTFPHGKRARLIEVPAGTPFKLNLTGICEVDVNGNYTYECIYDKVGDFDHDTNQFVSVYAEDEYANWATAYVAFSCSINTHVWVDFDPYYAKVWVDTYNSYGLMTAWWDGTNESYVNFLGQGYCSGMDYYATVYADGGQN